MDRVDEYTIYVVMKGLVTESVIRTPLQCIVQLSIWDAEWAWPEEQCVRWGLISVKGKGQFWGKMCPTSLTPL